MAPHGNLLRALRMWFANGRIVRAEILSDRAELDAIEVAMLD
jgi:hypothetical protein